MTEPIEDGVRVRIELTPENSAVEKTGMYWAAVLTHISPAPPEFPEYEYMVELYVQGEHWVGWISAGQVLEVAE